MCLISAIFIDLEAKQDLIRSGVPACGCDFAYVTVSHGCAKRHLVNLRAVYSLGMETGKSNEKGPSGMGQLSPRLGKDLTIGPITVSEGPKYQTLGSKDG